MFGAVVEEMECLGEAELADRLVALEMQRRQLEASLAVVVDLVARRGAFRADGHRSVKGWVKALINSSDAEVGHLVKLGQLIGDVPESGERLFDGSVGSAQVRELARVRKNPRCGDQLAESATLLLKHAAELPFADFKLCVRRWELLADPDGAFKDRELNNQLRSASVHDSEDGIHVRGEGGSGTVAAEMLAVFEAFCRAEFLADWDAAVAKHGTDATLAHMARTDAQRRFDALAAIFQAASSAPRDARVPEPTVNFVVDQRTFEEHLNRTFGDATTSNSDSVDAHGSDVWTRSGGAAQPSDDPWNRRSETLSGVLVHPDEIVAAALIGHVRRVVYDSAGSVIDLGRRRRLFTGAAKDAVQLQSQRCIWPGCNILSERCEADHTQPWASGGPTSPSNGGPACPHHNRVKNSGFTTRRDHEGRWHVYRSDGTEITQPPPQVLRQAA